jgi:hypothetical protein
VDNFCENVVKICVVGCHPKDIFYSLPYKLWYERSYFHCVKVGHVVQDRVQLCSYLALPGSNAQHKATL